MATHNLKTLHEYFQAVIDGKKKAEVRINDRKFKVGDVLNLQERDAGQYTGRECRVKVTHILDSVGLKRDYVMLSYEIMEK